MMTNPRTLARFVLLAGLLIAGGCTSTRSYDVIVTNRVSRPITIWLTKDQPPYGTSWEPPEEVALMSGGALDRLAGEVVMPGETAEANVKGQFHGDDFAVLRVYLATDLNDILAISKGQPGRIDLPLEPGKTDVDIWRENGALIVRPHVPGLSPPPGPVPLPQGTPTTQPSAGPPPQ